MRYLLDTNVISAWMRASEDDPLVGRVRREGHQIATAAPVWHELRFGWGLLAPSKRKETIGRFLDSVLRPSVPILDYDMSAADWHARERARLQGKGLTPTFVDGQIAAIAATRGLVVVTRNTADFERWAGVLVEDWLAESIETRR